MAESIRWLGTLPALPRFVLARAAVPRCLIDERSGPAIDGSRRRDARADMDGVAIADIRIDGGTIVAIEASPVHSIDGSGVRSPIGDGGSGDFPRFDLGGCQVWPCFVDLHTHLDKGHIWPRAPNADGTFDGALAATAADRSARWTATDVSARFEFGMRAAFAHGTRAMRTHLDSISPQHRISWPVFARLRERWQDRIELQAVTIVPIERLQDAFGDELADIVAGHRGILGAVVPPVPPSPDLDGKLDRIFALAAARGLDLDFHADESGDPNARSLRAIAEAKLRCGFAGSVVVGHCCSLAVQPDDAVERTLDAVAAADLAVVSLPMCNLFLQDRAPGRTPRWRGVTLLHELSARGVRVAIASDNCRDPFHGYGDHDMLEVFREAVRIAHLDRPVGRWPAAVTSSPATVMALTTPGALAVGSPADVIIFNARDYSELLSRPQTDRIVLRRGRPIDTTPPDYRELDPLLS